MPKRDARMVSLGYGKFVKADRIYALVPLDPAGVARAILSIAAGDEHRDTPVLGVTGEGLQELGSER